VPKTKARKGQEIDQIERWLREAQVTILTDYRGLSVQQISQLRGQLRTSGSEMHVVKNTLTGLAAKRVGIEGLDAMLEGPTAITISRDDIAGPARTLRDAARTLTMLQFKGAILGGQLLDAKQVGDLANLPTKAQAQANLVGNLQGVLAGLVGVLNGAVSQVVYTLEARTRQLEGEAA
jgi:large subunit ribosomal protein L10